MTTKPIDVFVATVIGAALAAALAAWLDTEDFAPPDDVVTTTTRSLTP